MTLEEEVTNKVAEHFRFQFQGDNVLLDYLEQWLSEDIGDENLASSPTIDNIIDQIVLHRLTEGLCSPIIYIRRRAEIISHQIMTPK